MKDEMHQMMIEDESVNSGRLTLNDNNEMQNANNPLLPEILSKVLAYLPQFEMVQNRSVCRFWRDTIDTHCTMKVEFHEDDEFLYQKLQLRIRECEIHWMPEDPTNILFAYPQTMKAIKIHFLVELNNAEALAQLLHQVKPYLHILEINYENNEENIFTPPFVFPLLRELRIIQWIQTHPHEEVCVNMDIIVSLFSHRMPFLKTLHFDVNPITFHMLDEAYKRFFKFLSAHQQTIKRLDLFIEFKETSVDNDLNQLQDMDQILPKSVKNLLHNGTLQLHYLKLAFSPRYASSWIPIIKSQKNLIHLDVTDSEIIPEVTLSGVPFNVILPGIESSSATLRTIRLSRILSSGSDGSTWIPFDCTAFRNVINLTELRLHCENYRDAPPQPELSEGAPIINLAKIPSACLKKLKIISFVCDSGDLQTLVDSAFLLEQLSLLYTPAPDNNPRFASTGVHGGIIHSFMQKPNKKKIRVEPINNSNQEENYKLDAVRTLYPYPYPNEYLEIFCRYF